MKNLKVGLKLGLGFGAVLLLTAILAVVGILNLRDLTHRSQSMELSSEILSNVQHFSVLSFDDNLYEDEQTLQEASSLLGVLQDNIAKLDSVLRVPRNKALLSELNNDTREYDQAMAAMVAAQRSRQQHI